jgi:hypothetical protein
VVALHISTKRCDLRSQRFSPDNLTHSYDYASRSELAEQFTCVPAVGAYRPLGRTSTCRQDRKMLHCITSQIGRTGPSCAFCCELMVASAGDDLIFGLGKSGRRPLDQARTRQNAPQQPPRRRGRSRLQGLHVATHDDSAPLSQGRRFLWRCSSTRRLVDRQDGQQASAATQP